MEKHTTKKTAKKTTRSAKRKKPSAKAKRSATPPVYQPPKTAAELGITCAAIVDGEKCGKPVQWFDYQLAKKNHLSGFVCDDHRQSDRVEKLAIKEQRQTTSA